MLRRFFYNLKHGTEYLNYGRDIVTHWAAACAQNIEEDTVRVIDIGLGTGTDLINIRNSIPGKKLELYGIESHEPYIEQAKDAGITVFRKNMEYDSIPVDDGYFHIVVANQLIEHIKEIFWVFGEISRVLRKGGSAIIGVPNLAALHNRVALLLGEQPTSVELLSEHVRGITIPSFRRFITCEGYFEVMGIRGSNFYPMPPSLSTVLSRAFPSLSVSIFFHLKRTEKPGNFVDILGGRIVETPYFRGKSNSLPG